MLLLGLTMSTLTAFAEQERENERGDDRNRGISLFARSSENENEHASESRKSEYSLGYVTVKDSVKIPSLGEVGSVSSSNEKPDYFWISSLSRLQRRGSQLIRERISTLQSNKTVIEANKTLTQVQKDSLTAIIASNVTGLTALSNSIASSTDATSTRELINSIYTNFRIYGVVIPQVRLEKRIYDLQNHSTKLSDLFIKVQAKIDEYKGKGKDVTVWQKSLEDAKVMVALDMNTLANLSVKVMALKPSDYGTTSKAVIDSANKELKNVVRDFNTIAKTLNKSKTLKNAVGSSTPTLPGTGTTTTATTTAANPAPTVTTYTTAQVAAHATASDCWIIVSGKVYSVATYAAMHPGGKAAITTMCGGDATTAFNTRGGSGSHSSSAKATLGTFLVGTL